MEALCIFQNDSQQLAAELLPEAGLSFSLLWIGNAKKEIAIEVTRSDDLGIHKWTALHLLLGDKISFITTEVNKVDDPIDSFTEEELATLQKSKPKLKPGKAPRAPLRNVAKLDCKINDKHLFSFHLNTDNMLSVEFVWLGDRNGKSLLHVGLDGSLPPLDIPTIRFGDVVAFNTMQISSLP